MLCLKQQLTATNLYPYAFVALKYTSSSTGGSFRMVLSQISAVTSWRWIKAYTIYNFEVRGLSSITYAHIRGFQTH